VMQDIGLFPSEDDPSVWTYLPKQNAIWQTFTGQVTIYNKKTGNNDPTNLKGGFTTGDYALRFYLLNGAPFFKEMHNPGNAGYCPAGSSFAPPQCPAPAQLPVQRITMQPGEVVRFRMLNGCSDNLMPIVVESHDMYLIALDGVNFPAPRQIPPPPPGSQTGQVLLAPANRAEFLIKGSTTPGVYKIKQLAQTQQFLFSTEKVIAEIEIKGPANDMALPTALPIPTRNYPLITPEQVQRIREIQFVGNFPGVINKVVGIDFLINNMAYQETAVPIVVDLDGIEEWRLVVGDKHHGGTEGHPFHIHVVSMEVILTGGSLKEDGSISGGTALPPGTFRTRCGSKPARSRWFACASSNGSASRSTTVTSCRTRTPA
ncbi:MAG: multicopper oxidase domain-containing protein, partial [Xanthobacteraceae bacterium]